jgi:hypothetical protein
MYATRDFGLSPTTTTHVKVNYQSSNWGKFTEHVNVIDDESDSQNETVVLDEIYEEDKLFSVDPESGNITLVEQGCIWNADVPKSNVVSYAIEIF